MDKNKILIRKDILKNEKVSDEAIAVYWALCKYHTLYSRGGSFISYLSIKYLEHLLFNKTKIKGINKILEKALNDLIEFGLIEPIEIFEDKSGVYDMTPLLSFDKKKFYVDIAIDELSTIMAVKYTKFSLLRYFLTLVGSFGATHLMDDKYKFKLSVASIDTLARIARISPTSVMKYNLILQNNKIIYIAKSCVTRRVSNSSKDLVAQISNVYSRYDDKKICNDYVKTTSLNYKREAFKVHMEVNASRKYIQMYNQMLKGREYDLETVKEIYSYVEHWNYKKRAEYMEKYGDEAGLEEKLKSLEVFKKYGLN